MSLEELVANYGYLAIVIGTFLEGETILVLGGFAAHRGFLELPWVMLCAFLGSMAGDQTFFYIGRRNGGRLRRALKRSRRLGLPRLRWEVDEAGAVLAICAGKTMGPLARARIA